MKKSVVKPKIINTCYILYLMNMPYVLGAWGRQRALRHQTDRTETVLCGIKPYSCDRGK